MTTEFSGDQFSLAYPDGIHDHWWHLTRNRIVTNMIKTSAKPNATVLDVGCGRGIVVHYLRGKGIDCVGVEPANVQPMIPVIDHVRAGMEAGELSLTERENYDTLLLLDVIEHVPDPIAFLQHLAVAFPNVSNIILTVPARQELWSNFDDFYGHYRRYDLKMLKEISRSLSASMTGESYFLHLAYPVGLIANLAKVRQTKLYAPISPLSRWAHKLISLVMMCDYHFLPKHVPGMSLIACFALDRNSAG